MISSNNSLKVGIANVFFAVIIFYPLFFALPFLSEKTLLKLNIYYFIILALAALFLAFSFKYRSIHRSFLRLLFLFSVLFLICLFNVEYFRYSFPVIFLLILIIFYIFFNLLQIQLSSKTVYFILLLYFLFSFFAYFDKDSFQNLGRFSGFTPSGSVYSTYLTSIYILFVFFSRSRMLKIFAYLACIFLIYLTQTRLNLLYLSLVPFIVHLSHEKSNRKLIFVVTILLLNLVYPAYQILSKKTNVAELRYEDGRDASFELRYALYANVSDSFIKGSSFEKLFGKGSESARLLVLEKFEYDHMPHNDFVRVLHDFGIIWFAIFFFLLYKISSFSSISCVLMTLYLLSFYHNMIFNLYLILLILLFANPKSNYIVTRFNSI